jgi:hypothetical protein
VRTLSFTETLFSYSFSHEKHKKSTLKVRGLEKKFSAALTAQNDPRLKIHFGNVSQDIHTCLLLCVKDPTLSLSRFKIRLSREN